METGTEQQGLDTAWMERILAASAAAAASGANTIFPATSELVMRQLQTLYAQQALILQSYNQNQIFMPQAAQILKNATGVTYNAPFFPSCPEVLPWAALNKPALATGMLTYGKQDDSSIVSASNSPSTPPEEASRKRIKIENMEKDDSQRSEVFANSSPEQLVNSSVGKTNGESISADEEEGSPSSATHCSPKKQRKSLSKGGNSDTLCHHEKKPMYQPKMVTPEENSGTSSNQISATAASITRKFRGVNRKQSGSWEARINCRRKWLYLGYFKTAEQAARAFDRAAISIRGVSSAVLNFPVTDYEKAEVASLQDMSPDQLVSYLKKESYRTNTATKFHRRSHAESADEDEGIEQACSGDAVAQEVRSLECDERDTPSEDVSQWTMSASKEAIANDNNKAENEESLSKYAANSDVQIAELMMSMKSGSTS